MTSYSIRPRGSCLWTIIVTVLFLGACSLGTTLIRTIFFPWSLSVAGKPAMTGEWSGPMALANGVNGTLMLTLEDTFDNQEDWFGLNIDGSAHYCLGGIAGDFVVYGKADRQGNIGDLRFYSPVDDPILLLHMMSSRWQGDALELSGTYSYDLSAVHLSRSDVPEPPISFRLGRTKIDTECAETVP